MITAMQSFLFALLFVLAVTIVGYAGAHSNIPAHRVHTAIKLCEPHGGLEFIDWSNAGCKDGVVLKTFLRE